MLTAPRPGEPRMAASLHAMSSGHIGISGKPVVHFPVMLQEVAHVHAGRRFRGVPALASLARSTGRHLSRPIDQRHFESALDIRVQDRVCFGACGVVELVGRVHIRMAVHART
jgi:hypothetical protein